MRFVILSALLLSIAYAAITELNCTTPEGMWSNRALDCDNSIDDSVCEILIKPTAAIQVGTNTNDRANMCSMDNTTPSEEVRQAMIKMCPKTCGYCCLTAAYQCKNKEFPGLTCETIKPAQCKDPKWREIIATDCPNVCGFCNEGGCVDAVIECANDISICRNIDMQAFAQTNCKKTCGFCANNGTMTTAYPGGPGGACMDSGTNCAAWRLNGFCESQFYNVIQKQNYCAKTCGLC